MRSRLVCMAIALSLVSMLAACDKAEKEPSAEMSAARAQEILAGFIPEVKVISVRESQVESLHEVVSEADGKKTIAYISSDGKSIFAGNLYDVASGGNVTKNRFEEINRVDFSAIPREGAIAMGPKTALNKAIIFTDVD